MPVNEQPEVMLVKEVALYLRLPLSTTYELVKTGEIPSFRVGRQIRISKKHLLKLLENATD